MRAERHGNGNNAGRSDVPWKSSRVGRSRARQMWQLGERSKATPVHVNGVGVGVGWAFETQHLPGISTVHRRGIACQPKIGRYIRSETDPRGCNSVGRVVASQAACRGFESLHPL